MKLLIVEDEAKTADYLRDGLAEQGWSVDVARDGNTGLHLAREFDYDVIVRDVMLRRSFLPSALDSGGVSSPFHSPPST